MRTIDFDVSLINKIHFRPSYHDTDYVWKADLTKPKYKIIFFGLFTVKDGFYSRTEGFYRLDYQYGSDTYIWDHVSLEDFEKLGYLIKIVNHTKEAWKKAYVEVDLGYRSAISRLFDTDEEANAWIRRLTNLSNKTFETIEYEN
jgi:hypothetical protein